MFNKKLTYILLISLLLTILSIIPLSKADNPPPIPWTRRTKTYGGTNDDSANFVIQTSDGGYALAGITNSFGAGGYDFYLVKTDAYGNMEWDKTYGGTNYEEAYSVIQTSDNGYVLAGRTYSFGADFWVVKTDALGNVEWNKTYGGGTLRDDARSIIQTKDNGYAIAGYRYAVGNQDFWLLKIDSKGNQIWIKTYGDISRREYAESIIQTNDDGYAIVGTTYFGDRFASWLVKTDVYGNQEWNKTFDSDKYVIIQTKDNGYALAGGLLIKIDANGNMLWNKTYGSGRFYSVIQTGDNGYVLAGTTILFSAGRFDFWLVKTDENGNAVWNQTFGGTGIDSATSMIQANDNTFVLAGTTQSFGAGYRDFWLVKTAPTLTTLNSIGGQLYPSIGTYSVPEIKDDAWLIAHPDDGYKFSHFLIDGIATPAQYLEDDGDYTYYLNMDTSHTVQAIFTVGAPVFPTLTVVDSLGGQIYPSSGNYLSSDLGDNSAWLIAHPNVGYKFNYFLIDGVITSNQYFEEDGDYTYYLALDTSHTVQAIFAPS